VDGEQAVRLAVEESPDLVLTDLLMPKLDGFGVCRAIRAEPRTAYIPVFLVTAISDENITLTALDAGADHVVSKPFSVEELRLRVGNAVARKVLVDELIRQSGFLHGRASAA
jgi:DNA-binding response OmpR family regulator